MSINRKSCPAILSSRFCFVSDQREESSHIIVWVRHLGQPKNLALFNILPQTLACFFTDIIIKSSYKCRLLKAIFLLQTQVHFRSNERCYIYNIPSIPPKLNNLIIVIVIHTIRSKMSLKLYIIKFSYTFCAEKEEFNFIKFAKNYMTSKQPSLHQ